MATDLCSMQTLWQTAAGEMLLLCDASQAVTSAHCCCTLLLHTAAAAACSKHGVCMARDLAQQGHSLTPPCVCVLKGQGLVCGDDIQL
jgi:hypothetical protein